MFEKLINYVVGAKAATSKGLPVDVRLSLDPDFKKTLLKSVAILTVGISLGVGAGIAISNNKKPVKRRRLR